MRTKMSKFIEINEYIDFIDKENEDRVVIEPRILNIDCVLSINEYN